nr:hypothetical protein [Lacticaseibacillus paracasei]
MHPSTQRSLQAASKAVADLQNYVNVVLQLAKVKAGRLFSTSFYRFEWLRLISRTQSSATVPERHSLAVKPFWRFFHVPIDITSAGKDSHHP